jgi:hypothetical protein
MLPDPSARLVFVGGLHRSGTSPVARWLAAHPDVSGFENTGAPEDEGQHLQDVYPRAGDLGGAGGFAFNAASHRTEDSPLVSDASRARLLECWSRHWDLSRPVLLEKSPPNLLSSRFLKALFPRSRLVMVVRHPIPVSLASRRWKPVTNDVEQLVRHWVVAHEILMADAAQVRDLAVVRYEDVMAAPGPSMAALFAWLGLAPHAAEYQVREGLNDDYVKQWRAPWRPPLPRTVKRIVADYEERVAPFGYSLREPLRLTEPGAVVRALAPGAARG